MDLEAASPHGHPARRRLSDPPNRQQSVASSTPAAFHSSPPHEIRKNPNQRRLQLRNSAFGTQLSTQRLGARFSRIFHGNEEPQSAPSRDGQQENRAPHRRSLRRNTASSHTLNSTLGILSEISNSNNVPSLRKRASIPIYEDDPERPLLERSPGTPDSQYHDASSTIQSPFSPLGFSYIQSEGEKMRLRETSGNERYRSPSSSSPTVPTAAKGRRKTTGMRKSSFEAAEYIDHIERQLEQVKQAMHSPQSGKPILEKMKLLKAENNRLKKAIDALESSFETRVKNSVEHMTAGEVELRRKVRCLEEDLRERDVRIEELEYEHDQVRLDQCTLETLKATIERLETEKSTLEDANRGVEKRCHVLSEMLAFSPTKMYPSEPTSPIRNHGRLPRPVSMMSCLTRPPSSPASKQASRPLSMVNSPVAVSPSGYFDSHTILELEQQHPCNVADDSDSGLVESCSAKSPGPSTSRRSTLLSQASTSPSASGLPIPSSSGNVGSTIRPAQRRKPRRFMTGSTQLKPLLLPTMAAESSNLGSPKSRDRQDLVSEPASVDETIFPCNLEGTLTSPTRDVSQPSIDPTISFISHPFDDIDFSHDEAAASEPASSPPYMSREPSYDLYAEGPANHDTEEDDRTFLSHDLIENIEDATGVEESRHTLQSPERRLLFSNEQLHQCYSTITNDTEKEVQIRSSPATQDRLIFSIEALMHSSPEKNMFFSSSSNPRKRRRTSSWSDSEGTILPQPRIESSTSALQVSKLSSPSNSTSSNLDLCEMRNSVPILPTTFAPHLNPISLAARAAHRNQTAISLSPKRLSRNTTPLGILQRRHLPASPIATVTIRSIYGTLSRYTTYICEFKRDPLALARRVIANAWRSNWKHFGKLSWWVIGVFLNGNRSNLAEVAGWDWDHYDGEAVAERICQSTSPVNPSFPSSDSPSTASPDKRSVKFRGQHDTYRTQGSKNHAKPVLKSGTGKQTGITQSLYLWGKFSVALMLAVGGAVWKGPAEMLKDCDTCSQAVSNHKKSSSLTLENTHPRTSERRTRRPSSDPNGEEEMQHGQNRGANIFSHIPRINFSKVATSGVFAFGLHTNDNFWTEDGNDDDPDMGLGHYHQPDYGENLHQNTEHGGFHPYLSVFS